MKFLTKAIREKLEKNAKLSDKSDIKPAVKFFSPYGAATWLITELVDDDLMFGLCDLGMGFPELGYVSLHELQNAKVNLYGIEVPAVEREIYWTAEKTLNEYADEAYEKGHIVS